MIQFGQGCVNCNEQYLEYLFDNEIYLFPWSSQARGFFLRERFISKGSACCESSYEEEKESGTMQ